MSETRFVITRPFPTSGLGCNLLSMVGALHLCERSNRSLIVDWTHMAELSDKSANYFVMFFEPLREWRGVDIFYVNDLEDSSRNTNYDEREVFRPAQQQYRDILEGRLDHRYLFLQPFHYHIFNSCPLTPAAVFHYTRAFYERLTPRPYLRGRLARLKALFERKIVIGLNVRTGNGEFSGNSPYRRRVNQTIFDRKSFLDRAYRACVGCLSGFPESVRSDFAVYVVTDCQMMQERLLQIPGAFAARKKFPPPGVGHQFADFRAHGYADYSDVESVNETIIDMLLLAECHGLVCNYTEYNRYAQYMTMFFNGNVRNVERYFEGPFRRVARHLRRRIQHRRP